MNLRRFRAFFEMFELAQELFVVGGVYQRKGIPCSREGDWDESTDSRFRIRCYGRRVADGAAGQPEQPVSANCHSAA
jgi:hypothetical protein